VFLKELVKLSIVAEFNIALLKMVDPIATCILNIGRKTLINPGALNFASRSTWHF
jgi:hypothetical protein